MPVALDLSGLPAHLSYSSFTGYMRCPKSWQLQRLIKVTEHPAWWFMGGRAVHRATEDYDLKPEGFDAEEAFNTALDSEVEQTLAKVGDEFPQETWRAGGRTSKEFPNKEDGSWWYGKGPQMVKDYIAWREVTAWPLYEAPAGVLGVELELLAVFGGIPVKMAIDRLFVPDGMLTVVDLKAGSREPKSSMQLGVYASGMEVTLGERPAYGAYFMNRKGSPTLPVELDRWTPDYFAQNMAAFRRAYTAQAFMANPGDFCGTCSVARACLANGGSQAHKYDPDSQGFDLTSVA